jgi:hypothetical protein
MNAFRSSSFKLRPQSGLEPQRRLGFFSVIIVKQAQDFKDYTKNKQVNKKF